MTPCPRVKPLMLFALTLLSACSQIKHDMRQSETRSTEEQLLHAGFKIMMADTRERQSMLNGLPPESVTRIPRPDNIYYIYADPDLCSCLYVGRQPEYDRLQQLKVDLNKSNRATINHEIAENQAGDWAPSGPWGNWGYWGITNPNSMGRPAYDPE